MIKRKVLLVDDEERLLASVSRNLRNFVQLHTLSDPEKTISYMKENGPFAVIISDFQMPKMNGIELLQMVQKIYPNTVRMMLTGQADLTVSINAINKGSIFRFLTKPCEIDNLKEQISSALRQYELVIAEKELLKGTLRGSLKVITDILSMMNPNTFGKSNVVKDYVKEMQNTLKIPNFWMLDVAASLYLIGFCLLPEDIIRKTNAAEQLSPMEQEMFDTFPELSAKIISNIPRMEAVAEIISDMNYSELSSDLMIETKVLRAVNDFLTLTNRVNPVAALEIISKMDTVYDPEIVEILSDVSSRKGEYRLMNMFVAQLLEGMILEEDVTTNEGILLIRKGQVLNELSITRLSNYSSACGVKEPIRVLVVKQKRA